MSDGVDERLPGSYPQSDVDRILERAVEIDARRSDHTSLELIREVAAEVGISEAALNEALRERATGDRDGGAMVERTLRLMPSVPVFGLGVGVIFRMLRPFMEIGPLHADAVVALGVMAATTLMLALRRLPESPRRGFQVHNLLLWLSFALGWSLANGGVWGDFIGVTVAAWLMGAVFGGAITWFREDDRSPPTVRLPPPPDRPSGPVPPDGGPAGAGEQCAPEGAGGLEFRWV